MIPQINLYSPMWKDAFKYLGWVLLFGFLWFRGCSITDVRPQIVKVIVPEVKGNFQAKKPVHEAIVSKTEPTRKEILQVENPIDKKLIAENEKLKSDFAKATDSIKKLSFEKAIQLNKFSSKFEDDNIVIDVKGIVRGEVQEVTPAYTIKKKTIDVPVKQKETVFRLLAGGAIGANKELNQAAYKLDVGFQNKKGNIISAEYLNVGKQEFGMIGYKISIFSLKK